MTYPAHIRKALRIIIVGQCVGLIATLLFNNGFMLAYFSNLGLKDYRILFLFAMIPFVGMLLTIPFSYLADRTGKKRLGSLGIITSLSGVLLLIAAPFISQTPDLWLTIGVLIFSAGNAAIGSSWFALLSPIVPEDIRGRWFGQMRMAWQTTAILFSLVVATILKVHDTLPVFQTILLIAGALLIIRLHFYRKIPELEPEQSRQGFSKAIREVLQIPGYISFSSYIFLISFFTGAIPGLFGLLEKNVLGFSNSQLVIMGNLLSIGTVAGFYLGGKIVDHFGTKAVFFAGHLGFSIALLGILTRGWLPGPLLVTVGLASLLFGTIQGAIGIASTSELLALIPKENKSLSTGLNIALISAGVSLSGIFCSQLLKLNVLQPNWTLFGQPMSAHDTLLSVFMMMIILMAATLQLVPTIQYIRSQWLPQNR